MLVVGMVGVEFFFWCVCVCEGGGGGIQIT